MIRQAESLAEESPDSVSLMANVSALLFYSMEDVNWAGFYIVKDVEATCPAIEGSKTGNSNAASGQAADTLRGHLDVSSGQVVDGGTTNPATEDVQSVHPAAASGQVADGQSGHPKVASGQVVEGGSANPAPEDVQSGHPKVASGQASDRQTGHSNAANGQAADAELILGPFQGKVACVRIAKGRGMCGTAWEKDEVQLVPDVHAFPGHIACDSDSRSEIVVPIHQSGKVSAVLDIDSPIKARFSDLDRSGLSSLIKTLEHVIKW